MAKKEENKKSRQEAQESMKKTANASQHGLDWVAEQQNKICGPGTMFSGSELKKDPPRLPTGVFAVDFATGGGLPIHGTTCFWGPDRGGKSGLAINAMSMVARLCWRCMQLVERCTCSEPALRMRSYWGDVEGTLDSLWAECIGADPASYVVGLADYGEQHVNLAEAALRADDCGLVVVDSLAMLMPEKEFDAGMEDQFIGIQARLITRCVRLLKQRLIRERKQGHPCTVLFVNQMRTKIGVMFGDPETMAGGHGMQHEFSLLLRMVKKSLDKKGQDSKFVDSARSKETAVRHSFAIRKEKVLTLAGVGEYLRIKEDMEEHALSKGQIDDFGTVMTYAKEYGIVSKEADHWMYFDRTARKLEEIRQVWKRRPDEYYYTQMEIVKRAKERLDSSRKRQYEVVAVEETVDAD